MTHWWQYVGLGLLVAPGVILSLWMWLDSASTSAGPTSTDIEEKP